MNRRLKTMNIRELLRLKQMGRTDAEVARLVGCHRQTVAKYRRWAREQGLLEGGKIPGEEELQVLLKATASTRPPRHEQSTLNAFEREIRELREDGVRMTAIAERLEERHGVPVSYEALRRLVRRLELRTPKAYARVEVGPGAEAQVDFGYAGRVVDPETGALRKAWVFVMLLSHSRHMYAELVYDQTVETWLTCHIHAFEFFGGVPASVVLDNLKAAILKHARDDVLVQRSYRELAEHYDFLIDPNPPRQPHLKGKVEKGGVDYVKNTFLAGREPRRIDVLNAALARWCVEKAGRRRHGTTKKQPVAVFEQVERPALKPLPREPYDLAVWKRAKLHRDCHVTFEQSYYSAPFRLVGQTLLVRGGLRTVRLYATDGDHELVATHERASQPGQRKTCLDHLPPDKAYGVALSRDNCMAQATAIGPETERLVQELLDHRPENRLRTAGRVLALSTTYGTHRLERACARSMTYGEAEYRTVKNILEKGLDLQPWPSEPTANDTGRTLRFARSASEFVLGCAPAALRGTSS